MTNTAHTPTPWQVDGEMIHAAFNERAGKRQYVNVAQTFRIGNMEDEHKDNAAHIVRCVNAHDDLVAALRQIHDISGEASVRSTRPYAREIAIIARAALAKVET